VISLSVSPPLRVQCSNPTHAMRRLTAYSTLKTPLQQSLKAGGLSLPSLLSAETSSRARTASSGRFQTITTSSSSSSSPPPSHINVNGPIRWGILSAGRIASDYAKAISVADSAVVSFVVAIICSTDVYLNQFKQLYIHPSYQNESHYCTQSIRPLQ
jgi:hypothetical protein